MQQHVTHFYARIGPMGAVRIQYGWALEFPNSNVGRTIGPGNFLIIYVYFIYGCVQVQLKNLAMIYLTLRASRTSKSAMSLVIGQ